MEACLGSPELRGGAFSPTRPVGKQWLMKLASDEKRMVGPAVAKKRLVSSSFHPCQCLASFSACFCFDSVKIVELAPTMWLISVPDSLEMTITRRRLTGTQARNQEPSQPLLVPHHTPTATSVTGQLLTPSADICGIDPCLRPASVISTFPSSHVPQTHCSSSLLSEIVLHACSCSSLPRGWAFYVSGLV